ncbi:uncharacterized protein LOC110711588 [Chenopodium quinoa]|uniref:uncharacterized protein LOC110711588 n=1 Tax=Chenopodium quinoa TaxID=63459 RepID=UPI000B784B8C|nr:uncharacterized protein LOC110711588 [Chenopodium quinoa]
MAYLLLYVDDIILATSNDRLRTGITSQLQIEFPMSDVGPLSYFFSIAMTLTLSYLFLSQQKYAQEILECASMASCKPATTPVDTNSKLSVDSGPPFRDPTLYRSLAGALQYLTFTKPDIAYAVLQVVCLFKHDPRESHYDVLKRILCYVHGTIDRGFYLYSSASTRFINYTNANWGGCPDTRRSTFGYYCFLGDNLVFGSSKRQPTLYRVQKQNIEASQMLSLRLIGFQPGSTPTHQTCGMDIHFVREKVALGEVRVLHVPSRYQFADIFTKGLPRDLFLEFRSSPSIRPPPAMTAKV